MGLSIPWAVLMDLQQKLGAGISSNGASESEMANGDLRHDMIVPLDLRLMTSSGATVLISDLDVSVDTTSHGNMILLGMGVLEHFDLVFKKGSVVLFELSDPSVKRSS